MRPRPLALGQTQSLPVPGKLGLGEEELELHPTAGHVDDGMAILAPWLGVLCVGDYVSDVEIPWMHESGDLEDYRGTLARLAAWWSGRRWSSRGTGPRTPGNARWS